MKTKLDELFLKYSSSNMTMSMFKDLIMRLIEEEPKPPYDREAFRRELIVGLCGNGSLGRSFANNVEWINTQADAIIAEYGRRQGNG
jgi:hypothetical protein